MELLFLISYLKLCHITLLFVKINSENQQHCCLSSVHWRTKDTLPPSYTHPHVHKPPQGKRAKGVEWSWGSQARTHTELPMDWITDAESGSSTVVKYAHAHLSSNKYQVSLSHINTLSFLSQGDCDSSCLYITEMLLHRLPAYCVLNHFEHHAWTQRSRGGRSEVDLGYLQGRH